MDVGTAIAIADHSASLCISAGKELRRCFRDAKYANEDIQTLLNRINKVKSSTDILRFYLLELKKSNIKDLSHAISFNEDGFAATIGQILELASKATKGQSRLGFIQKLSWVAQKRTTDKLIQNLEAEQRSIAEAIHTISGIATLRTNTEFETALQANITAIENLRVEEHDALSDAATLVQRSASTYDPAEPVHPTAGIYRTWLGHILTNGHTEEYLMLRKRLSDAAYWGDWSQLFKILDEGSRQYGESWVNAVRMKPLEQSNQMSFWTPLHQAVYNNAPLDVIRRLIEMGASRTLRSRYTEFSYKDMSALELAHDLQMFHLYDILCPVIRSHIPSHTLAGLENKFHALVSSDLGDRVEQEKLYLPLLELSTEFEKETVWFPVKLTGQQSAGYLYLLEGRELVVRAINIRAQGDQRAYRITEDGVFELGEVAST